MKTRRESPSGLLMNRSVRRGSALITTLVMLTTLAVLAIAFASVGVRWNQEQTAAVDDARAFALAEGGVDEAAMSLLQGTNGDIGTMAAPVRHGDGLFWVEGEDIGPLRVRLRSTALVGKGRATVEMVIEKEYNSIARYALFSDDPLLLASNTLIDSYDPANGPYVSQPSEKPAGVSQPLVDENAIVMCNSDIVAASNVVIGGDSTAGPNCTTTGGSGFYVSGSTDPAKTKVVESLPPTPTIGLTGTGIVNVTGNSEMVVGPGNLHFLAVNVNNQKKLRIKGPATVVIDALTMNSGSTVTFDSTNGPVKVFMTGMVNKFVSNSNLTCVGPSARDVQMYFTNPLFKNLDLASNATFQGAMFAPYANVKVSSNWHIYGALGAKSISMASNSQLHFDESLLRAPGELPIGVSRKWWGGGGLPAALTSAIRTDPYTQLGIQKPEDLPKLDEAILKAIEDAGY
jgi:hypothetical protein